MSKTFLDVCVPMGDNRGARETCLAPPSPGSQTHEGVQMHKFDTTLSACESASAPVVGSFEGGNAQCR